MTDYTKLAASLEEVLAFVKGEKALKVTEVAGAGLTADLINWLQTKQGVNLVSDDGGKWAVSGDGFQPVPDEGGFTCGVTISVFVHPDDWRDTISEAVEAYIANSEAKEEFERIDKSEEGEGD